MTALLLDLRFALRTLLRRPGFTLAVVLTLALSIGANSAIFTLVQGVLLRPLPLREPGRLVQVWGLHPDVGQETASLPDFRDWREGQSAVRLAAVGNAALNLTGVGEPQRLPAGHVSADLFEVLGAEPVLGRGFTAQEERKGQGQVVVLSHALWRRAFAQSPAVLGRTLTLDGVPHTVVGVAPEGLGTVLPRPELWVPLAVDAEAPRRADFLRVFGRLAPGASVAGAQAQLREVAARLEQAHPDTNARWSVGVVDLHEELTRAQRPALLLFMGAVALVLLIACANVANLLLAQGVGRARELAVRAALGAGRGRLVRQLLTESLLLSSLGGALGLLFAVWGVDALAPLQPRALQALTADSGVDVGVVLFTLLLSLVTGTLFGLAPALRLARGGQEAGLRQAAAAAGGGARRLRSALVLGEVALALVLLVGAGLLLRSFGRLQSVDPGFRPEGVLSAVLSLPKAQYPGDAEQVALYGRLLERVEALPGVKQAALTSHLPLTGSGNMLGFGIEGRERASAGGVQDAHTVQVSARYFETLGIALREGRGFGTVDAPGAPEVAVVNEALARRYFPGASPVGARLTLDGEHYFRVVGVVGDVRASELGEPAYPQIYLPLAQAPSARVLLAVRAQDAAAPGLAAGLRREVAALDPQLPLAEVQPLETYLERAVQAPRVNVLVLGLFAAVALVLAALGIYGMMASAVAQRTREIGIRMALGAEAQHVVRLVVGQGMLPALAGVALGLLGALAGSRLLAGLLYGVGATDLLTFALVSLALLGVALLATWLPARRATRVQPTEALRAE